MLYDSKWEQETKIIEPWRQHLLNAAERLETHGWCQGTFENNSGARCALGAIAYEESGPQYVRERAASEFTTFVGTDIPRWNDKIDRQAGEVIGALRACALTSAQLTDGE